ncbi:hypothetical protein C5S30_02775 [ANME-1 cluster archaeon GoMg4]|nr:hypothetical protein [ANME-1 cluster archaeon GoMg4]
MKILLISRGFNKHGWDLQVRGGISGAVCKRARSPSAYKKINHKNKKLFYLCEKMKSIEEVKKFSNKQFEMKTWSSAIASIPKILTPIYAFAFIKPWILLHFLPISELRKKKNLLILDFGCGAGNETKILSNYFPRSRIIGIDISDIGIKQAHGKFSDLNFLIGDCQCLSLKSERFDLIYSTDVFGHIPNLKLAIQEFSGIFKKGGRGIIFTETNGTTSFRKKVIDILGEDPWVGLDGHISLYPNEEIRQMLSEAGLKIIDYKYHPEIRIPMGWDSRLDNRYPQLRNHFKFERKIGKIINYLRSLLLLKYIVPFVSGLIVHILLHFQKRDVGGMYIYVEKI